MVNTLADRAAKAEVENLGNTPDDVEAEAVDGTLSETLTEVEAEKLNNTLSYVEARYWSTVWLTQKQR